MKRVNKCLIAYCTELFFCKIIVNKFFEVLKRLIYERKMTMRMMIGACLNYGGGVLHVPINNICQEPGRCVNK